MNPMPWMAPVHVFFAVRPPARLCPAIETLGGNLKRAHRLRGRPITPDRVHNTLAPVHAPGCALQQIVERASWVGARIRYPPFAVRYEWTQSFDVRRAYYPLVLRGEGGLKDLTRLQREICARMGQAGFTVARGYTPHITLLWADRVVDEYPIAPIEWMVTEFVLVLSMVGRSRHVILGHWQLG